MFSWSKLFSERALKAFHRVRIVYLETLASNAVHVWQQLYERDAPGFHTEPPSSLHTPSIFITNILFTLFHISSITLSLLQYILLSRKLIFILFAVLYLEGSGFSIICQPPASWVISVLDMLDAGGRHHATSDSDATASFTFTGWFLLHVEMMSSYLWDRSCHLLLLALVDFFSCDSGCPWWFTACSSGFERLQSTVWYQRPRNSAIQRRLELDRSRGYAA